MLAYFLRKIKRCLPKFQMLQASILTITHGSPASAPNHQLPNRPARIVQLTNPSCLELLQKPQIILPKIPDILHVVLEHGDALGAHAKGKAGIALGVIAAV